MIKTVLIISYLYGVLPLMIGITAVLLSKHRFSFPLVYTSGYVIYLAFFELLVAREESKEAPYIHFVRHWELTIYIITIAVFVCLIYYIFLKNKKHNKAATKAGTFHFNRLDQKTLYILIASLALLFLVVFFLVPHAQDETPELARLSISSDSLFSTDPSTGTAYSETSAWPGCLHLFYAFGSTITGIDVTTLIHLIMPVFMLPFFVCSYLIIARLLYPNKEQRESRYHFIWLILIFYLLLLPLEAHIALVPYRNIWNGITLAASCLFPLFFTVCICFIRSLIGKSDSSIPRTTISIISLICLSLAIQLSVRFGLIICLLFVLVSVGYNIIIYIMKRQSDTKASKGGGQL